MINVTKPSLPDFEKVKPYLEQIWDTKVLSNNGPLHTELEARLADFLGLEHVSLFCNATIALITAQQALDVTGEVITTPYSFVATAHAINWMRNTPVFVDVEPDSLCLDPALVEAAVTPQTKAIMPLHCYGNTCATEEIERIADKHDLKIIYDACHSFGVEDEGGSVLRHGDVSVVSFHATKVFNTFEGGLLVSNSAELKRRVDHLKNFGFESEVSVVGPGINGKMSEFNAAVGLAQMAEFEGVIARRASLDNLYRELLAPIKGISCQTPIRQTKRNYAYFPIFVDTAYPLGRDALYQHLLENGVHGRRYFYPLISQFPTYANLSSADAASLPFATWASSRVICLPLYADLADDDVHHICRVIREVV